MRRVSGVSIDGDTDVALRWLRRCARLSASHLLREAAVQAARDLGCRIMDGKVVTAEAAEAVRLAEFEARLAE